MRAEQQYIDLFSQCEAMICRHSAEVLNAPRAQAFADFEKLGFPTRKQEKYKYTDVSKLFEPDYGLNLNRLDIPVNPYEVFKCDVPNMSTALYFVVNDAFYRKALPKSQLPEGVLLGSLKELSEQYPALVKQYYGKLADTSKDGVTAFNTTFAQDGFMLYVPKGVVVDKPIQLVNILRADVNFMVNRRVLVVLEEGAQARLLICDHAMDNVNFLSTQVIEVFAKENATFDLYELEETHTSTVRFSNLYVNQEADSNVLLNGMTLHNGTTRNTTEVTLAGRGAEINLCGMVIADKNEQVDNHTFIDHKVADCTSNELFKYVLDDQATGAFAGKVLVREGAQHTNSQQTNRNLCATRDAHMYTQPQLEIYADDVKCSHGATVGQLDENALFYMQQRGISLKEARLLLMFAFVNEVIDTIRLDALKEALCEDTILVSIMYVNNEVGSVQPIQEAASIVKAYNRDILFHVDAVQGFGKYKIYPKKLKVDMCSISGHKIHGPKGVGALYIGENVKIRPIVYGGGQQHDMRSGTENVPGIAGLSLAAKTIYDNLDEKVEKMRALKQHFIEGVEKIENTTIHGLYDETSAPHIISVGIAGIRSEVLLHALEDKGIYVSSGSACASNHPQISGVLKGIGAKQEFLDATLRFSMSEFTTLEEIDYTLDALYNIVPMLRRYTRH